jgi:hypothetical protein
MAIIRRINRQQKDIMIYGSHHRYEDAIDIKPKLENFQPEIVCAEATLGKDISKHSSEILEAKNIAEKIGAEFWHIDLDDGDFPFLSRIEDLDPSDQRKVSGTAENINDSRNMRQSMREVDEEMHKYNLERESGMIAAIREAINRYNSIFIVIGAAHFNIIYRNIQAVI